MTTPTQLKEYLVLGHEQASVEFKGPSSRSDEPAAARVMKAMMAMANHRDGGVVVIGVDESDSGLVLTGVSRDQARSWSRDHLGDLVAAHAEPPFEFESEVVDLDGKQFVVVSVHEFADVPVICRRQFTHRGIVLIPEGACYVRPRRKPESVEVGTYVDMKDLLDLATEKGVRRFVEVMQSSGIKLVQGPSDAQQFRKQAEELL